MPKSSMEKFFSAEDSISLPPPLGLFQDVNIHKGPVTCFNTTPVCNVFKQGVVKHMTHKSGNDTNMHEFCSINALGYLVYYPSTFLVVGGRIYK